RASRCPGRPHPAGYGPPGPPPAVHRRRCPEPRCPVGRRGSPPIRPASAARHRTAPRASASLRRSSVLITLWGHRQVRTDEEPGGFPLAVFEASAQGRGAFAHPGEPVPGGGLVCAVVAPAAAVVEDLQLH